MRARRRSLGLAALAALGVVLRRRLKRRAARVDVYFEDGSMVSLDDSSAAARRLLPVAHDVLRAARS